MSIKQGMIGLCCAMSLNAVAGTMGTVSSDGFHPWSVVGSIGYAWVNSAYQGNTIIDPIVPRPIGDGQTALGRLAIARELFDFRSVPLGVELGVQNGNVIKPNISQADLDVLGGLYPQLTNKPTLDLLATATWQPSQSTSLFGLIKAGIAYRQLQVTDRNTFNDLSQVAFEIQIGLGKKISERAILSLNYQGLFNGKNTTYTLDPTTGNGHISNIPQQNGLLLSLSYSV